MRSVFITGTGTGVGKTVVTAAICAATGARPMKPAQTGSDDPLDLELVWRATGRRDDPEIACPYRLPEPLAPAVAARRAGVEIDLDRIGDCFQRLSAHGTVAVEGAGGLLVGLTEKHTMADLAGRLGLPLVVVCRPGLGTLNHTALTVEAAARHRLEVVGLVISGYPAAPGLAERTNPQELARIAPLVGVIPHISGLDVEAGEPGDLAARAPLCLGPALGGSFDAAAFLEAQS